MENLAKGPFKGRCLALIWAGVDVSLDVCVTLRTPSRTIYSVFGGALRSIGWFACEPSEHHHLFLIQILISQQITTLPRALAGHSARSVPITTKTPTAVLLAYTNLVPVRRSKAST